MDSGRWVLKHPDHCTIGCRPPADPTPKVSTFPSPFRSRASASHRRFLKKVMHTNPTEPPFLSFVFISGPFPTFAQKLRFSRILSLSKVHGFVFIDDFHLSCPDCLLQCLPCDWLLKLSPTPSTSSTAAQLKHPAPAPPAGLMCSCPVVKFLSWLGKE